MALFMGREVAGTFASAVKWMFRPDRAGRRAVKSPRLAEDVFTPLVGVIFYGHPPREPHLHFEGFDCALFFITLGLLLDTSGFNVMRYVFRIEWNDSFLFCFACYAFELKN